MITIKDVAMDANVSVATVSRVINQNGYVSEKARKSVEESIKKLNYRPNAVARSLYNKSSKMIGLLFPDIMNPFFPSLARAVEKVAIERGYIVALCNTEENFEKEKMYLESLQQQYIDGIIITSNNLSLHKYKSFDFPVVALDRTLKDQISTITSKNKEGAWLAAEHLVDCGCTKVAHIRGPKGLVTADERVKGFLEAVHYYGIDYQLVESKFNILEAEKVTRELLMNHPDIDGIFAASDVMAAGVIKAIDTHGLSVPYDIQVVGFDGIELGSMITPSLTTVEQPIFDMGILAAETLIEQIESKETKFVHHEFPTCLVKRQTTKSL